MQHSNYGLENHGLKPGGDVHWNLQQFELLNLAVARGEGTLSRHGAFVTETGDRTGRSAKDKFTVVEPGTEELIWWDGTVNRPYTQERFDQIRDRVLETLNAKETLFV